MKQERSHGKSLSEEPNPVVMSDSALWCAIEACKDSRHESDRQFAKDCEAELHRRRVKWLAEAEAA